MAFTKNQVFLFCFLLFASIPCSFSQDSLIISELMAVNNDILQDEDGDYSDWIEIHNTGSADLSLKGWALTDNETNPLKWIFPDFTIAAKEYLVVFASEKDRWTEKNKLHTNFKLSSSGEYLALMKPGGKIPAARFSPAYPGQYANISYGISASGFQYFSEPTPGAENTGEIFISPPLFTVGHGFFQDAFDLGLYSTSPGVDIYYTTDASTPGRSNGTKCTGPVHIHTTTVIRAIAVNEAIGESPSVTQSYIFPMDVINQSENQPGYPDTWLSPMHGTDDYFEIPSNYSMKADFIAKPEVGKVIIESLMSLPVVSIVSDIGNFFSKSTDPDSGGIYMYNGEPDGPTRNLTYHLGRGWERPASVEYFNSDADDGFIDFQAGCGVKIHGGATRTRAKTEKHSLRLGFKAEYGPSKLNVRMFGKSSPGQYDWLVLRGGFAPRLGQQIRDPWAKSSLQEMGQYAARSKFVHVYINGLYWGMYNLSERMDNNCMRDNLGGNADDYDLIKDYFEVESGDTIAWSKLVAMAEDHIESPENYQKILGNNPDGTPSASYERLVNPENLIDYIMMNMYAGTQDWDYHNWIAARRKTDSEGFHFLTWDAEGVFQGNNVSHIVSGGEFNRPTGIFSDLMKNEQFKNHFISRVNKHFFEGGALTPAPCMARYERWLDEIDTALISDQSRWVGSDDIWNKSHHQFRFTYFPPRSENVFKQFIAADIYPEIEVPVFNTEQTFIPGDFRLMMTAPEGSEIRYTLDGTDPGHFNLAGSSSIVVYDNHDLPLSEDTLKIMARVKKDTLWSQLVIRQFIIDDFSSSFADATSDGETYLYCYPNPVKNTASIVFNLPEEAHICIKIYTILGVEIATIADRFMASGEHTLLWETGNLPSGIYICQLENRTENSWGRIRIIKE